MLRCVLFFCLGMPLAVGDCGARFVRPLVQQGFLTQSIASQTEKATVAFERAFLHHTGSSSRAAYASAAARLFVSELQTYQLRRGRSPGLFAERTFEGVVDAFMASGGLPPLLPPTVGTVQPSSKPSGLVKDADDELPNRIYLRGGKYMDVDGVELRIKTSFAYTKQVVITAVGDFVKARKDWPRAHLVLASSVDPNVAFSRMERVPGRFRYILDVPKTVQQLAAIYGSAVTPLTWSEQTQRLESAVRQRTGGNVVSLPRELIEAKDALTGREYLLKRAEQQNPEDTDVLIAHVSGENVRLHDGSQVRLTELSAGKGQFLIIACSTLLSFGTQPGLKIGTGRDITYSEAADIVSAMESGLKRAAQTGVPQESQGEVLRQVQMMEIKRHQDKSAKPGAQPSISEAIGQVTITIAANDVAVLRVGAIA